MAVFTITVEDEDAEEVVSMLAKLPYVEDIKVTMPSESKTVIDKINHILTQSGYQKNL